MIQIQTVMIHDSNCIVVCEGAILIELLSVSLSNYYRTCRV